MDEVRDLGYLADVSAGVIPDLGTILGTKVEGTIAYGQVSDGTGWHSPGARI